jgi:hypothetical protein
VLRMDNLCMQVSRAKQMPAKGLEHNPGRTALRDLIRWGKNRTDLESSVVTGMEAAAQVPFRDLGCMFE